MIDIDEIKGRVVERIRPYAKDMNIEVDVEVSGLIDNAGYRVFLYISIVNPVTESFISFNEAVDVDDTVENWKELMEINLGKKLGPTLKSVIKR